MKKQILKNIFSNYLVYFLQMVLGILIVPFLIAKLGKNAFGLIILAESTITFFEFIAISIRISLSRHATFALSQGNHAEFIDYLSSGKYILLICGGLVLVLGSVLSYFFPNIFHVPIEFVLQTKILFFLITIAIFITIPNIINWSILYAKQRFDLINLALSGGLILRACSILLLFSFLPKKYTSLITYGFIYLLMRISQNFLVYLWRKKVMPGIKLNPKHFKIEKVRELISFSGYTTMSGISTILYDSTSNILINLFYGPSLNAVYAVSLKFPTLIKSLFLQATWTLAPTVTDLAAKKDTEKLERLFFTYSKLVSIITIPLSLFLIMFSDQIINLWVGKDFSEAGRLLKIHMLPLIVTIPFAVITISNNAYAKVRIPSQISLLAAVCNVILGTALAKIFNLGLYGFAISATTFTFLVSAIFMPYYSCKITNLSLKKYWLESFIWPFLLGCFVVLPLSFLIKGMTHNLSLGIIFIQGACILLIYYFFSYIFIVDKYEKDITASFLKKRFFKILQRI